MEELVTAVLVNKPPEPVVFMIDWLRQKTGYTALTEQESNELKRLRNEVKRLQLTVNQQEAEERISSGESNEEDYLEVPHQKQNKGQRGAVSSEAYGTWNKETDFVPRVIEKSQEQKSRIVDRLSKSFMFAMLEDNERNIVIDAMEERKFQAGDYVIKQGDDGAELFVVDTGELQCEKLFPGDQTPRKLKVYQSGEAFGELALLYNAPRAATIIALTDSILLALDRGTFNNIVKKSAVKKRERYEEFMARNPLFCEMDPYERTQIIDAFQSVSFQENEYVMREGEQGDQFYIIEDGEAIATKTLSAGEDPVSVMNYKIGDYFGELALLRGEPRAANIIATTNLKCATLDRFSFKRLLGPLELILQRNAEVYEKFLNK